MSKSIRYVSSWVAGQRPGDEGGSRHGCRSLNEPDSDSQNSRLTAVVEQLRRDDPTDPELVLHLNDLAVHHHNCSLLRKDPFELETAFALLTEAVEQARVIDPNHLGLPTLLSNLAAIVNGVTGSSYFNEVLDR